MKIVSTVVLLSVALSALACSSFRQRKLQNESEAVILKTEDFKVNNSRLPESLSEIGVAEKEEGPIYYRKTGGTSFEIWFGADLGESVTYNSVSKEWRP
jgi:hypothetical protein